MAWQLCHPKNQSQTGSDPLKKLTLLLLSLSLLLGCSKGQKTLKVAATAVPHAEMLEFIKPDLKKRGVLLEIVEIDDYQLPNRLLAEKQVDANFFQHLPFLNSVKKEYDDQLVVLAKIHYEPLGIYSKKMISLNDLGKGAKVAIPCDPSNETRALLLLDSLHLIELKDKTKPYLTIHDLAKNPRSLVFSEIDSPLLPRILEDVDVAVIPANFALQAKLDPDKQALALETTADYPNVLVIHQGDEGREDLLLLKELMTSHKMHDFLCEKYHGAIQPLF